MQDIDRIIKEESIEDKYRYDMTEYYDNMNINMTYDDCDNYANKLCDSVLTFMEIYQLVIPSYNNYVDRNKHPFIFYPEYNGKFVYKIRNKINSRVYIGRSKNIVKRVLEHILRSTLTDMKNDMLFYGINNFEFKAYRCVDMVSEEKRLINNYIENGYNLYNKQKYKNL